MKKTLRKIIAAVSAVSVIAFSGLSVSAATADDVISAAYGAGISDQYVQTLIGFLKSHDFTSAQYDMMVNALANIESIGDDIIKEQTGHTLDELRGGSSSGSSDSSESDSKLDEQWKDIIKDNMSNEQMLEAINEMASAGKKMGYNVTVDKKGDKSFVVTVKDADGNIQMIAPVGQVIDRTGVSDEEKNTDGAAYVLAVCGMLAAAAGAGAWILSRKNEEAGE